MLMKTLDYKCKWSHHKKSKVFPNRFVRNCRCLAEIYKNLPENKIMKICSFFKWNWILVKRYLPLFLHCSRAIHGICRLSILHRGSFERRIWFLKPLPHETLHSVESSHSSYSHSVVVSSVAVSSVCSSVYLKSSICFVLFFLSSIISSIGFCMLEFYLYSWHHNEKIILI